MKRKLQNVVNFGAKHQLLEHRIRQKLISSEKLSLNKSSDTSFFDSSRSSSFQKQSKYQNCNRIFSKSGSSSTLKVQPRKATRGSNISMKYNTKVDSLLSRYSGRINNAHIKKKPILLYHKSNIFEDIQAIYKPYDSEIDKKIRKQDFNMQNCQGQTKNYEINNNFQTHNELSDRIKILGENINFMSKDFQAKSIDQKLPLKSLHTIQYETIKQKTQQNYQFTKKKQEALQLLQKWKQYAFIQPFKGLFLCKYCLQYFATIQQANHFKNCRPPFWREAYKQKFQKLATLIDRLCLQAQKKINIFAESDLKLSILYFKMQELLGNKEVHIQDCQEIFAQNQSLKNGSLDRGDLFWLLQKLIRGMDGLILRTQNQNKQNFDIWRFCS